MRLVIMVIRGKQQVKYDVLKSAFKYFGGDSDVQVKISQKIK